METSINNKSNLILVRHGQSIYNLENRFTGWEDVELTKLGLDEANQAGLLLKNFYINSAFTSNLKRAQKTLDTILKHNSSNPTLETSKDLNERDYGDLVGQNKKEAAIKFGKNQVQIWRRSFDVPPPSGESLEMTYNRTIPYFKNNIISKIFDNNVLISAHGNSLRAIIMYLFKYSKKEILKTEIGWCEPIIINFDKLIPISFKLITRPNSKSMSNFPRNPFE